MFLEKELKATEKICDVKIKGILIDTEGEWTADSLRDLQTLMKLKDAANQKIQKGDCF